MVLKTWGTQQLDIWKKYSQWVYQTWLLPPPVQGHEHEGVDGDEGRGHDEELVELAPKISKWPGWGEGIVCSCEGDAEHDKQNISNLQCIKYQQPTVYKISATYSVYELLEISIV